MGNNNEIVEGYFFAPKSYSLTIKNNDTEELKQDWK
jgi:hypothetical protein